MTNWGLSLRQIPDKYLIGIALVLTLPAFLLHLGAMTFIGDEAIRSLVALEMKLSGNWLAPTLNGELYFNKPPLFNWVILLVSGLWGDFGEWPARLSSLLFLGLFAWIAWYFARQQFDRLSAASLALMLLTSGRILIWDSMLGLIDICFSAVVYLNFMLLYHLGKQGRWPLCFFISYFLGSLAFMLKGLPAVVFQAVSILTALWFLGVLRKQIFSRAHFLGMFAGLLPLFVYYAMYAREVSLAAVFATLFDQSMQRTATQHGIWKTVLHVFSFPAEQVYHFLPWSLLLGVVFHPKFWSLLKRNEWVHYAFWLLLANLPVYWLSVEVYPRYLLMFIPLFNAVAMYVLQQIDAKGSSIWQKVLQWLFFALALAAALGVWATPLVARAHSLHYMWFAWLACAIPLSIVAGAILLDTRRMFVWLSIGLLVFRIAFDLFVLPFRMVDDRAHITRDDAARLGKKWGDRNWLIYGQSETHQIARFYTTRACNKIIRKTAQPIDPTAVYLVDRAMYPDFPGFPIDSIHLENGQLLGLMQLSER